MMMMIPFVRTRNSAGKLAEDPLGLWVVPALKTDIRETDDAYFLETEVPGVRKEDIELIRENNVLTIAVKAAVPQGDTQFMRRERVHGEHARRFVLENIDEETISAKLDSGILYVMLPKKKPEQGRITID